MGFVMEFAENLILKWMEDPKERDHKFREHVYAKRDRCQKMKEMWSYPLRPYGFWTFERHNSQLAWDAQISQVPGRRDPYDDVLQRNNGSFNFLVSCGLSSTNPSPFPCHGQSTGPARAWCSAHDAVPNRSNLSIRWNKWSKEYMLD